MNLPKNLLSQAVFNFKHKKNDRIYIYCRKRLGSTPWGYIQAPTITLRKNPEIWILPHVGNPQ